MYAINDRLLYVSENSEDDMCMLLMVICCVFLKVLKATYVCFKL